VRAYRRADHDAVLALVNADRLPGQPRTTREHLREALAGRSPIDSGWWAELSQLHTDVLVEDGRVTGAVAFARQPRNAGVLLWLHAGEDPDRVAALVEHVMQQLQSCAEIHAFEFASALTLGLEALPLQHRPVTAAALERAGLHGQDLWCYMRCDLSGPGRVPAGAHHGADLVITSAPNAERSGTVLTARRGSVEVGEAVVSAPQSGVGVLWWLEVADRHRGTGAGRALLHAALQHLHRAGAHEVILYVDDDEPPGGPRDRAPAKALYTSCGFVQVDRLVSFTKRAAVRTAQPLRPVVPSART
jgi:ribosomal protein S18 acetylase RimI-like enzyme